MIIESDRCTETGYNLYREMKAFGIPCFYIRTKIDLDIENGKHDYNKTEEQTLQEIRQDIEEHGFDMDNDVHIVYLINNININYYVLI